MKLNTSEWKPFRTDRLFPVLQNGKANQQMLDEGNDCFYIGAKRDDNGVMIHCMRDDSLMQPGNCMIFICNGQGSVGYANYMDVEFIGTTDIVAGYNDNLNPYVGAFLATVYSQERPKYSFGRKWKTHLRDTEVNLPIKRNHDSTPYIDSTCEFSDDGFIPDWKFMEDYIQSLHYKPLTTNNVSGSILNLNSDSWYEFRIGDLFDVKYGINLELTNCDETTQDDAEAVAFVSRTADNNGVSAYVKRIEGKEPQPAETITVAGGGSVLSTFVQRVPFYSGRDLYLLLPKDEINLSVKLFVTTIIAANQYRFSYGRQANKTLPYLELKLPVKLDSDGKPVVDAACKYSQNGFIPDWDFMERYMKSLPYGDKL